MRVGLSLTAFSHDSPPLAKAAEELGFESVWVPDHPVFPAHPETRYPATEDGEIPAPYRDMADPFVLLGVVAGQTSRIRLATGVTILPERHPLTLANTVATLDRLSGGRVILGIGSGWLPEEIALYGVDFNRKWTYAEECALAMRALWTHGTAGYTGRYINFPEVGCYPQPVQRPVPMVIGSAPSPRTFDRVARIGDGWYPTVLSPDEMRAGKAQIDRRCQELGRDPSEVEHSVFVMDASPKLQQQYAAAGVSRIVIGLHSHPGTPVPVEDFRSAWYGGLAQPRRSVDDAREVLYQLARTAELAPSD